MKSHGNGSMLFVLYVCLGGLLALAATQPPGHFYLPLIIRQGSPPTSTPTPTVTPAPTSTPFFMVNFAHDLSITALDGTDPRCRVGNGCTLFRIQARNLGNRPVAYQIAKTQTLPLGWGAWFCWEDDCDFSNFPPERIIPAGGREVTNLNFRVPLILYDGEVAAVDVTGGCHNCTTPPFQPYLQTFTVLVILPTPTATPIVTATPIPTATPTPTSTPFVHLVFAHDLSITTISGQEPSCRTGNGCTLFQIQVRNVGNRSAEYQLVKTQTVPVGWGVFFCWATDCEFGNAPPPKTLAAGARDTVSINFRVPSVLFDHDEAVINVTGSCPACTSPPFTPYTNTFRVLVVLPTPTPQPTGTFTPTPTSTPTATGTPTATATAPGN